MKRPPAPSSARLSTEDGGGFPAHGLAPDQPSPLLLTPNPVPGSVLEGSEDELPPSLVPVPEEFVEDLSPLPVPVPEGCEDAPSLPAVSRRLRRRSPRPRRMSKRSPRRASELHRGFSRSCQIIGSYITGLLSSYVAGLLIAGPARNGIRTGRLNSGSAGDGLWVGSLNSCFCGSLGTAPKGRGYVIPACVLSS
ncbi:hypothetical protein AMECASPLE_023786 [Ameca splendens]|uniref:Uncharacterized protein n=1 Tax=Ameca splendens TaxID=208324 RepID=A0ABV0ZQ64_9TELE